MGPAVFVRIHSHVTEHVLSQNNTVQLPRVGNHDHSGRVDELVLQLELWVLFRHELGNGLPPQTRSGEDVCLVDGDDGKRGFGSEGDLSGNTGDTFDFWDRVDGLVPCNTVGVGFLTLAEVCESVFVFWSPYRIGSWRERQIRQAMRRL